MSSGIDHQTAGSAAGLPLSYGQEQLWFLDQLSPGESTYNIMNACRWHGLLDADILRRSLSFLVARHEILRATIQVIDGVAGLAIAPSPDVILPVIDFSGRGEDEQQEALDDLIREQSQFAYDLQAGPLYRFLVVRLSAVEHVFFECFHHIVTDGWSVTMMNGELSAVYRAFQEDREPHLPSLKRTYADFIREQRQHLQSEGLEEELKFWEDRLAQLPVLEFPADRPRPSKRGHRGQTLFRAFDPEVRQAMQKLSNEYATSLFMVLTTAVNVVLSRYTAQQDIPLGVPMLGRLDPELEGVIGLFINMVVLRSDLSGDPTFEELIERTAEANLELYEYQEVPFNLVVDRVQPTREPGRNPLFQVSVQILDTSTSGTSIAIPGVTIEWLRLSSEQARYDIALNFLDSGDVLTASVEYSTDLFDRWRIEALLGHIETVLRAGSADPSLRLSQLPLLTEPERGELLAVGRGEVVPYPDVPLHVSFAKVAAIAPDETALVCRGAELTYRELDQRADLLARYLRSLGVRSGEIVAVILERDLDAYVAMLGILKAGAAFSMLDPKHPASRLDFMIKDTAAPVVVTRSALVERLPGSTGWTTVLLDSDWPAVAAIPAAEPLEEWATADSTAYVLYTSGSTGVPKGVIITHRAVSLFTEAYRRTFDLGPEDRLLQLPALTFDMSQGELWTGFLTGAAVIAVAPDEALSPEALSALMRQQRVTYAGLPPAILSVLEPEPYPALRYIMGGAEVLPADLVNKWNLDKRRFVNLYGPTEAAIACTEYECEHKRWQSSPPIGRPQVNRQVYVVDQWDNLVPKGIIGELLIGGDDAGLARGYLNQPELTAEKFVTDPFDRHRRVYRSGDMVRWNADGELEFLGRADSQVKLRGLRIELSEIESALAAHPDISRAVVLMRPDRHGENRLIGYFTSASEPAPEPDDLRRFLAESLPEYMVPTAWVALDEFPLSYGWKVNNKALPDPAEDAGRARAAAGTPTEEKICGIYTEVLAGQQVGADDAFFRIGGNSLQAMRAVSRINKMFGVKVSIRMLYGSATVRDVAAAIDQKVGQTAGQA